MLVITGSVHSRDGNIEHRQEACQFSSVDGGGLDPTLASRNRSGFLYIDILILLRSVLAFHLVASSTHSCL